MSDPLPDDDIQNAAPDTTPPEGKACPFRGFISGMREVTGWVRQTAGFARDIGFIVSALYLLPHHKPQPVSPPPAVCPAPVHRALIYNN